MLQLARIKQDKLPIVLTVMCVVLLALAPGSYAKISGVTGSTFDLTAKAGYIRTPDGNSIFMWSYAHGSGQIAAFQYPGPTLIVTEGETVTITLYNELDVSTSIVFPGQNDVVTSGGNSGLITQEAASGSSVTYSFVASNPGTFTYYSGTQMEIQVEMGLVGALIVRPAMGVDYAYNDATTFFDQEYLFLLTEIDPVFHELVEFDVMNKYDNNSFLPVYWLFNGRAAPDTMHRAKHLLLPNQPYNCLPRMNPGNKVLFRFIGGGRDAHPFHHHGNNSTIIAENGRLRKSSGSSWADVAYSDFTITVNPGQTVDSIYEWTGHKIGWDVYGHQPGDPLEPGEDPEDHGKPFPVIVPKTAALTYGTHYSGSPYLGEGDFLPPGTGGFNRNGGFFFMAHSHNEQELTNNDIFPGGMMTMIIVEPPSIVIPK